MKRVVLALGAFIAWTSAAPAVAQRGQWDAERYNQCLSVQGESDLATDFIVRSLGCRRSYNPVVSVEGGANDITLSASVAGARNKDHPEAAFVAVVVGTRAERTSTALGGSLLTSDRRGFLSFRSANALVDQQRVQLEMEVIPPEGPTCRYVGRGNLSGQICSYVESATLLLDASTLADIATRYQQDSSGTFRVLLTTQAATSIEFAVPLAEIEAVRRRIFPSA